MKNWLLVFMFIAGLVAVSGQPAQELVFSLPVGGDGLLYRNVDRVEDAQAWGPSALAVADDGTFWLADAVAKRVRGYDRQGQLRHSISLNDKVVAINDICLSATAIFILDSAASHPQILQLDFSGALVATYPSPVTLADGLSGIAYSAERGLLLEIEGGARWRQFLDPQGKTCNISLAGYPSSRGSCRINAATRTRNLRKLRVGALSVEIAVQHELAAASVLHINPAGDFYLVVDEMALLPEIKIDRTVRHYSHNGEIIGTARVPRQQQLLEVPRSLALTTDGQLYALTTHTDGFKVWRLPFISKLEAILPAAPKQQNAAAAAPKRFSITRAQIISNAAAYLNNSKYLSATNISGSCSGRTKPRYLGNAGTYSSVPYDWGGWDTVASFNSYMDQSYTAGDIHTSGVESCSRGVDCSGFVTRAWGRTDKKYGTSTLNQISYQLSSTSALLAGDAMNKAGSHVRLFDKFANNGVYCYEATTGSGYDRVVYRYLSWSSMSGYVPIRYDSVESGAPPTPGDWPTHSTSQNNSGANVYAIQYLLRQHGQSLTIDGAYGPETADKVKAIQSACDLSADGIVAADTWQQALIVKVSRGSYGDAVRAVQHLLVKKFGHSLTIDGDFGPATQSAVTSFQGSQGLDSNGIVDAQTWLALVRQ